MAANISKDDVIEFISNMTVLELSEFVKALEEKFGVSAAAPVAMMAAPAAAAAKEEAAEKTEFEVIKEVRAITALGLKEAKALVDGTPGKVKEGISRDEAEKIKKQLEEAGATVEIK
jgi:large subunit ribosomal protein L7/L12